VLASAGGELNSEGSLVLWQANTGKKLRTIDESKGINETAFDVTGRRVAGACANAGVLKIWDVSSGREEFAHADASSESDRSVAFAPDGKVVALASNRDVRLLDLATGKEVHACAVTPTTCRTSRSVPTANAWPHRASTVLSNCGTPPPDRRSSRCTATPTFVWHVAFSRDGRRLVSCGQDHTIKIWDATPLE